MVKYDASTDMFSHGDCVICTDVYLQGQMIYMIPECKHIFH